jgi:hypothetical protein
MTEINNEKEYNDFLSLTQEFTRNLKQNYQGKDANQSYEASVGFGDALTLIYYKSTHKVAEVLPTSYNYKAKKLVTFCEKSLPFLTRTFGEEALQLAFLEEMKQDSFIKKVERLGGQEIANVLRQKI